MADNVALANELLNPDAYPWRPESVKLIETHISWVFLAGDRVLKLKRPVEYGFVDHRSLESRKRSCEDEVRLNRRLTTNVYLDAVPITLQDGRYRVGGDGEPVEWGTLMRRLPADRMLDVLLEQGTAPADLADLLAARLVPFHREVAERCDGLSCGTPDALLGVVTDNLDQLHPFAGRFLTPAQLTQVDRAMRAFASGHKEELERRAKAGWVRDGHGDLRLEHVCLEAVGAIEIFDCVEFSLAIRCADVASDLAFLLMDLERVGASQVADAVLAHYGAAGASLPAALVCFYQAHRALVRTKVACLTVASAGHAPHPTARAEAADYLNLATRFALRLEPLVVVMTGLSGTGKSTVARAISRATGAALVSSDDVRKRLAGVEGSAAAGWQEGIYGPEWTASTYARMIEEGAEVLAIGRPVILDATFLDPVQRSEAARLAEDAGVQAVLVETTCDEAVAIARIEARQEAGESRSDAGVDTYIRQKEALAEGDTAGAFEGLAVQIDTTEGGPIDLNPLLSAMGERDLLTSRLAG